MLITACYCLRICFCSSVILDARVSKRMGQMRVTMTVKTINKSQ